MDTDTDTDNADTDTDSNYVTLETLVTDIASFTGRDVDAVRATLAASALERCRPMRLVYDTGDGAIVRSPQDRRHDSVAARLIAPYVDLEGLDDGYRHHLAGIELAFGTEAIVRHFEAEGMASLLPENLRKQAKSELTECNNTSRSCSIRSTPDGPTAIDRSRMWTTDDVAAYIGKSASTVRRLAAAPDFPRASRPVDANGRESSPLYFPAEIDAWLKASKASKASKLSRRA